MVYVVLCVVLEARVGECHSGRPSPVNEEKPEWMSKDV
jgi:hypothetical protein